MEVIYTPKAWNQIWKSALHVNKKIGLVPTMGALHLGHLDLVKASKKATDLTVVSIFVNPTQFNDPNDFQAYPKTLDDDLLKLKEEGVNYVFVPSTDTIYPEPTSMQLDFGALEKVLEGANRPGHFNGVGIIVSKLFNLIRPHQAFFGQKDLQQVAVIKRLVSDLNFQVDIKTVPTRREEDGLAFSSRNVRLNPSDRKISLVLYQSLNSAKEELFAGESWLNVQKKAQHNFEASPNTTMEYFELVNPSTFEVLQSFDPKNQSSICVAAKIGDVRLIDNLSIVD